MFESLHINEKSGVPVWVQIRNSLIFLIKSEQIKPGDVLPTVRELATQLGVNYNTIHKVYQDLEADSLICSSRGKRSFVADVDRDALALPESPVDLVIDELVRVARESNVSEKDVLVRVKERFLKQSIE
ncbi:MAG: GntR family transcriptional regulator [Gordonibacter sp.]|uniref:GntR family transcriptional regulator n=1 Tax=Gordonibacter sp. TaxID=1968902 RepID=UPI002FCA5DE5